MVEMLHQQNEVMPSTQRPNTPYKQSAHHTPVRINHHTTIFVDFDTEHAAPHRQKIRMCHHHAPAGLYVHLLPPTALSVIDTITSGTGEHDKLIKGTKKDE
jgi:hypothetical protein